MNRDDEVVSLEYALQWQRDYVRDLGSPVAAAILEAALRNPDIKNLMSDPVRFGSLPGLRWMAAIHRLAIDRLAPGVAMHLPTLGGTPPTQAGRDAFMDAVSAAALANPDVIAEYFARVPQTNETSRAAVLRCALSRMPCSQPVRLFEFGCSAGLNLLADLLPGLPALEAGPMPNIIDRVGCDLRPVDARTPEGRAVLSSYVWVDDIDRWTRLQQALDVESRSAITVKRQDAADFVREIEPVAGSCTVIWHSAMWIYLDQSQRREVSLAIEGVAAKATLDAPVVHISWEWHELQDEGPFELAITTWNGTPTSGATTVLATGTSHGTSVVLR